MMKVMVTDHSEVTMMVCFLFYRHNFVVGTVLKDVTNVALT